MSDVRPARCVLEAPAKVNLSLELLHRRADGYHEIRTIMQAIDMQDRLELEVAPGDSLQVDPGDARLPRDRDNLVGRAIELLLARIGATADVRVTIRKRIPVGAGLGGGSSNAAAALLGLHGLLGRPLGAVALFDVAGRVGSDVPFFLCGGTCACSGRGERVRRIPALPACWIVLVTPPVEVRTAGVYAQWDRIGLTPPHGHTRMLELAVRQRDMSRVGGHLWNDLEAVILDRVPQVKKIIDSLLRGGAVGARMSGSGSAVFGLFENEDRARRIVQALSGTDHIAQVTRPVQTGAALRPGSGGWA